MNTTCRNLIKKRDKNKCFLCSAKDDLEVHHIHPKWNGGSDSYTNLTTLCFSCHRHRLEHFNKIEKCVFKDSLSIYAKKFAQPKDWEILLSDDEGFTPSKFTKTIGITEEDMAFIIGIKGKKSKSGKLQEIINFYKSKSKNYVLPSNKRNAVHKKGDDGRVKVL